MEGQVAAPNPLELFWEQHKKPILAVGLVLLAGVAAFYLKRHYDTVQRNLAASRFHFVTGLDQLITSATPSRTRQFLELDLDLAQVNLAELDDYIANEAKGTLYEPWAIWVAANSQLAQGDPKDAEARLNKLKGSFPKHVLCSKTDYPPQVRIPVEKDKDKKKADEDKPDPQEKPDLKPPGAGSPVERLLLTIASNRKFREQHLTLFEAPKPDGAVVDLLLNDTKVVVRLYKEAAPAHTSHFLKLVKDGFYNGQKVYKIQKDPADSRRQREPQLLHLGLAKTKETNDTTEWDRAAVEPSKTTLDFPTTEQLKKLSFFPGMLAVENEKDGKTSGERVFLTANDCASSMDGDYVILGKVVSGLEELQDLVRTAGFTSGDEDKAGVGKPATAIEISITSR